MRSRITALLAAARSRIAAFIRAHADLAILVVVVLCLSGVSLFWTAHEVRANDHKFCSVVQVVVSNPVPKPADPASNPSREHSYVGYVKFVRLGHDLGCY